MGLSRNTLLWASRNKWLKQRIPKMKFVQNAVKQFLPGETEHDAIAAARNLLKQNIATTFTYLGENISSLKEAEDNKEKYINLLEKTNKERLDTEISLKLTQLGFDQSFDKTFSNIKVIIERAENFKNSVFIDIEDSSYVNKTIEIYKKIKGHHENVGLCLQAYLYRTIDDIKNMIDISPWIRLVKGAYKEPESAAFKKLKDVNKNYMLISKYLLNEISEKGIRVAFATHDLNIQEHIKNEAKKINLKNDKLEFQMLYGIKTTEQYRLALEGYKVRTLISYGEHWYPWYMRRLAERPANVGFILKNLFNQSV
jgi:proline dehydrogenase